MADAKKCDVCEDLYECGAPDGTFRPKEKKPVAVVIVKFRDGKKDLDVCPTCIHGYLVRMTRALESPNIKLDGQSKG